MKNLILVRHAKSSWEYQVTDFERPLKNRGLRDSKLISSHVSDKIFNPDLILSSDANRAKTTAAIFIETLKFNHVNFQLIHELYDFSGSELIQVIKNCKDDIQNVMVFGHNHAITAFTNTFGSKHFDNVPTCGLIHIRFNIDSWKDLNQGQTILSVFPKELK